MLRTRPMVDSAAGRGVLTRGALRRWLPLALATGAVALACALPRDPEGTLERVRGGELRVGVVEHPAYLRLAGEEPEGPKADLVRDLARELDARIVWLPGRAEELARAAEGFGVDLLAGGWEQGSKLAAGLGVTRPFHTAQGIAEAPGVEPRERRYVWLVPPGENAWLLTLDEFLVARRAAYGRLLAEPPR